MAYMNLMVFGGVQHSPRVLSQPALGGGGGLYYIENLSSLDHIVHVFVSDWFTCVGPLVYEMK